MVIECICIVRNAIFTACRQRSFILEMFPSARCFLNFNIVKVFLQIEGKCFVQLESCELGLGSCSFCLVLSDDGTDISCLQKNI